VTRNNRIVVVALAAGLLAVLPSVDTASAHGDDPRIEIDAHQLAPGASLTVRGFDFPYEDVVALALAGSDRATQLGSVTADLDGAFTHTITVPIDAAEGVYTVMATAGPHVATSSPLLVRGAPLTANGDTRLEDDDSLLVPMPVITASPATASTVPSSAPVRADAAPAASSGANSVGQVAARSGGDGRGVTVLAIAVVAAGLVVVAVMWTVDRRRRTRRRQRTVPSAPTLEGFAGPRR
jgi:hypothetical protein